MSLESDQKIREATEADIPIQRIEIGIYTDNLASQALGGELGFETYRVLMQKSN